MLYYTSLFLIIALVSVIAIWVYRGIFGVGRAAYRSSVKGRRKISKREKARLQARRDAWAETGDSPTPSGAVAPTPWGWNEATGQMHSDRDARNPGTLRGHARSCENMFAAAPNPTAARKNVGWPYKEEKMKLAGKAYKVNRKGADGGDGDGDGKPWVC